MHLQHLASLNRYVLYCTYEEKDLAKINGFSWDKDRKHWFTQDILSACRVSQFASKETLSHIHKEYSLFIKQMKDSELSEVRTGQSLNLPCPLHLSYFPYQQAGISLLNARDSILLADEMGLGKTVQAIGYINLFEKQNNRAPKTLVVCPAGLKLNWLRELRLWLVNKQITVDIVDPKNFRNFLDICIINYDLLRKFQNILETTTYDLVIMDEAHYCKNGQAQRTKFAFQIKAKKKILMTGTPIVNRPAELFPLLKYLNPDLYPNFWQFSQKFCGSDGKGASNLEELQARLRASVMIRRLKKDVLTELPPKLRQIIEIPVSKNDKFLIDEEILAFDSRAKVLGELNYAVKRAKEANDTEAYKKAVQTLRAEQGSILEQISKLRKTVALAKVPHVVEHVARCLESSPKIVLFCHHHEVIDEIRKAFLEKEISSVVFSGRENAKEKQHAVDSFQNENIQVFIGSITAASVGLTLTAASHVIFAEMDWVPSNLSQAEDRCHRIGQKDNVLVQHIVLAGSLDYRMVTRVIEKQQIVEKSLNALQTNVGEKQDGNIQDQGEILFNENNTLEETIR